MQNSIILVNIIIITLFYSIMSIQIGDNSLFKIQLYLVRHGETTANRDDILQGHCDYPLTEQGIKQAEYCGIGLKDINWYRIYSSDLFRAYNTCCLVLSQKTINAVEEEFEKIVIKSKLIRELNFGIREALPRSMSKGEAISIQAKRLNIPIKDIVDTTETYENVYLRQKEFLTTLGEDLYQQHLQEQNVNNIIVSNNLDSGNNIINNNMNIKNILCLSHGGFIKQFLKNFCKNIIIPDRIHNCGVNVITIEWPNIINDPSLFTCATNQENVNISYEYKQD